jgi:hypothetical protein
MINNNFKKRKYIYTNIAERERSECTALQEPLNGRSEWILARASLSLLGEIRSAYRVR